MPINEHSTAAAAAATYRGELMLTGKSPRIFLFLMIILNFSCSGAGKYGSSV